MIFMAFALLIIAVLVIAMILVNKLFIRETSSKKTKDIFSLIVAIIMSVIAGVIGFFLTFLIGEGLMEVISEKSMLIFTYGGMAVYNFIVCLFIGRFYPKSIWFAGFLVNIIVWAVIISNFSGSGGFIDLWYGWTPLIVFAFAGSFVGFLISKKRTSHPFREEKEQDNGL
ncbi:MAG: hypothetical protein ACYCXK_04735 [Candidatus Humimicrobiaceae bacterium]